MKLFTKLFIIAFLLFCNVSFANTTRFVITSNAGGITYRYALLVAPILSEGLNRKVVPEIRAGAEGYIAATFVNQFRNQEEVVLMIGSPKDWKNINSSLTLQEDFITVAYLGYMPHVIVSNQNLSFAQILEKGKTQQISYAISLNNPARPLLREIVKKYSNSDNVVEVTFKSGSEVVTATIGKHVSFGIIVPEIAKIAVNNEKLKIVSTIGNLKGYESSSLEKQGIIIEDIFKYLNHVFIWSNLSPNKQFISDTRRVLTNFVLSSNFKNIEDEFSLIYDMNSLNNPEKVLLNILDK
jgi:tripartite-type tricarboxylate transporter receptor subunit TctC